MMAPGPPLSLQRRRDREERRIAAFEWFVDRVFSPVLVGAAFIALACLIVALIDG